MGAVYSPAAAGPTCGHPERAMTTKAFTNAATTASSSRAGFTLVEIMIVLLLIGLLAGIAAPNIDRAQFQLKAASRELVTRMAAAKHMAVLKGHDVVLAFDQTNRRIRIHSDLDNDRQLDANEDVRMFELPEDVAFGKGSAPAIGAFTGPLNLSQSQTGLPTMTFHRNGSTSQQVRFYLTSRRAAINGGFPEDARSVAVARSTGTISCQSYASSSWRDGC